MNISEFLTDCFERIGGAVHSAVDGLDPDQLDWRPGPEANPIGWLVWHLTRVQDDHIAHVAGAAQAWTSAGWAERFALPLEPSDIGYGNSAAQVAQVAAAGLDAELLLGYFDDVQSRTLAYVSTLVDADLDRVVDTNWDPPVTLGVRLVSVVSECNQHAGQAAYLRGLLREQP